MESPRLLEKIWEKEPEILIKRLSQTMNSPMFNDFMLSDTIKIFSGYNEIKYLIIYCRVYFL